MPDVNTLAAAIDAARRLADAGAGLWGPVDARWIVALDDAWFFTERVLGATPAGELWHLDPPPDAMIANTAVPWDGRLWAMVQRPVADVAGDRVLLLHELWHGAVQPRLLGDAPTPAGDGTLEAPRGRALFRAELAAWCRAALNDDAGAAIAIRDLRRRETEASEWERQRVLELSEGLAEYSGRRWAGQTAADMAASVQSRDPAQSLVRSACYDAGPAIGYALDRLSPGWRRRVTIDTDLGTLAPGTGPDLAAALDAVGFEEILVAERERDGALLADRERRREAFAGGRLIFPVDRLTFDPRYVDAHPQGTLYTVASLATPEVALSAEDGLLVAADWSFAAVACPSRPEAGATRVAGPGWHAYFSAPWESVARWSAGAAGEPLTP